jgi:serine/threonine protein kinase
MPRKSPKALKSNLYPATRQTHGMTQKVTTLSSQTILSDINVCPRNPCSADETDKIVRLLGQGTFGKVVEARNVENRRKVAIKIIRAVQKYRDASKIEIRVLETLRRHDSGNTKYVPSSPRPFIVKTLTISHCIHMDEYFDHRNHPCIVSELYGMSVFDFLKQNSFSPFPERHIQDFAKSLLKSVDCMSPPSYCLL